MCMYVFINTLNKYLKNIDKVIHVLYAIKCTYFKDFCIMTNV